MAKFLRTVAASRYTHLLMGLILLYGVSFLVTYTSRFEKILESLRWYCVADYEVRDSLFSRERMEAEFYRGKYEERLDSLTAGLFDWRDEKGAQAFFSNQGFLYDVRPEGENRSYLLAAIVAQGKHEAEVPEKVVFNYVVLGKKKIPPLGEYREGRRARVFVSAGDETVYLHRDTLEPFLRWYFESLWKTEPQSEKGFYIVGCGGKDPLTYFLYRDLQTICQDIFIKKFYRDKKAAKEYFMEEGFKIFLPTFLTMAARMAADQGSGFRPGHRYLRALLTGLSLQPNYTMFYLSRQYHHPSPPVRKALNGIRERIGLSDPGEVTLDLISRVAQETLDKLEGPSSHK